MKYVVTTLGILLGLSLCFLGFNLYNFNTEYSKTNNITKEIREKEERITEIDKYLEDNKTTYDEFLEKNKTKIEVYEKWLRYQKEVEKALEV